jgi:hypothetical protein
MTGLLTAFVVTLLFLQTSVPQASISGDVMKHGTAIQQLLQNARLELTEGPGTPLITRTDVGGRFAFLNLAPGRYRLSVTRDGFVRQDYPKPIVVAAGARIDDIIFQLDGAPTVAGWVQDEYGSTVPNVLVEALRRTYDVRGNPTFVPVASAITDDRGEYRIFWVDPGDYFFFATSRVPEGADTAAPVRGVAPTYFPGVSDPADARPLRLNIGREVTGVDFQLRRAALVPVSGYLSHAITGRPVAATITLSRPADDPSRARYQGRSVATGRAAGLFSISEPVPPGPYIVTAKGGSGEEISGYDRIVIRPVLAAAPYDLRLRLSPPLTVNGRITRMDSGAAADLSHARVSLISVNEGRPSPRSVSSQTDGRFSLTGVAAGDYVLDVSNLSDDSYVKAARFGATDVLEKLLTVDAKQSGQALQILLGSDEGRLNVRVFDSSDRPQSEVRVVLVPDLARRDRRDQYRTATTDEYGQASVRGIPPGMYKVFAWESIEPNAYLNSDFVRAYEDFGVPVQIASGENAPMSVREIRGQ